MKSIFVRTFALSLVATGVVASAQIMNNHSDKVSIGVAAAAIPVPTCPPNDPNACGMGQQMGH